MRFRRTLALALLVTLVGFSFLARGHAEETPPYLDPAQPLETRVHDLVSRLTLPEKAALMKNDAAAVPRLQLPKYDWWNEALHGVARAGEATVFPQAIGLAAMWDDGFMKTVATTIGIEARAKYHDAVRRGVHERYYGLTFWSPNINIFRDPRWGRGQETYGEDPYLTSRMGVAFVRGLQGDDPRYLQVAACAKHFAVHSGPEPLRHDFNVDPSEADLYDTYLPAFEALVREARVEAVMTAYNSVLGQPCAINDRLYRILYDDWKFNGHVVSDCGAIYDLYHSYKIAKDAAEAEALAKKAGLCVTCGEESPALVEAVQRGLLTEKEIDQRLFQLVRTWFRLGLFDPPSQVRYAQIPLTENNSPAHAALALEAARKSIVLLKNDGLLPLKRESLHRLAVIGPNANSLPVLLGNYNGTPTAPVTVLAGIQAVAGAGVTVDYVKGCDYVAARPGWAPIPRTALRSGGYTGLDGEYFSNRSLEGAPTVKRRDRPITLNWRQGNPVPGLATEGFSARWTGEFTPSTGGEYQIRVVGNGGVRLFLGNEAAIDAWTPGQKTQAITRTFRENEVVPVRLEFFQADGPAEISLEWTVPDPKSGFNEAVALAGKADAVVFVGGISSQLEGEEMRIDYEGFNGGDRTRIELPAVQQELVKALLATGKPVVFILLSGSAVALPELSDQVPALVEAWYPGQSGGRAIADVLFGEVNPAGRLPITFYRATSDLPPFIEYSMAHRTYRYFEGKPLYPFGHGLSFTHFTYANLRVETAKGENGPTLKATVDLTNAGERDGDEVVQLYLQEPADSPHRSQLSLGAFRRVALAKGETKSVTLPVSYNSLRRWNTTQHRYEVSTGEWKVLVGASSGDIRESAATQL